jgi:hypothetical protein
MLVDISKHFCGRIGRAMVRIMGDHVVECKVDEDDSSMAVNCVSQYQGEMTPSPLANLRGRPMYRAFWMQAA